MKERKRTFSIGFPYSSTSSSFTKSYIPPGRSNSGSSPDSIYLLVYEKCQYQVRISPLRYSSIGWSANNACAMRKCSSRRDTWFGKGNTLYVITRFIPREILSEISGMFSKSSDNSGILFLLSTLSNSPPSRSAFIKSMYNGKAAEYRPGFIAFSYGFSDEVFRSSTPDEAGTSTNALISTPESVSTIEEERNRKWQDLEGLHREHQRKIQDEELKAELEYVRLGGRLVAKPDLTYTNSKSRRTNEVWILSEAWKEYDKAWDRLFLSVKPMKKFMFRKIHFTFDDIPWPILKQYEYISPSGSNESRISVNDLTANAITQFLLHPLRDPSKSRKEKLREAILHYHPDKFQRFLHRITDSDRARVLHGIDAVIRALNELVNIEM